MSTRAIIGWAFAAALGLTPIAPAGDDPKDAEKPHITIKDEKVGAGAEPKKGDTCTVH